MPDTPTPADDAGPATPNTSAGASARAVGRRRLERWRARQRSDAEAAGRAWDPDASAPAHITAWEDGAVGEEVAAARFQELGTSFPGVVVLHDRRASRRALANIDHLLIGPAGVVVADTKAWHGRVAVRDGELRVNGRRRTDAATGVLDQVAKVRGALARAGLPNVPVFGVLHWVHTDGVTLDGRLAPRGVPLLDAFGVLVRAYAGDDLDEDGIGTTLTALERELPPATRPGAAETR